MTVVKVQRALYSSNDLVLVYAEGRRHTAHVVLDEKTNDAMGSDMKAFFEGTWNGTAWKIGPRVKGNFRW